MQQGDNNFLDSKTILAIVLVGVVWFGWQNYISQKYPQTAQVTQPEEVNSKAVNQSPASSIQNPVDTPKSEVASDQSQKATQTPTEKTLNFENDNLKLEISSLGLAVKNISLKNYSERDNSPVLFNEEKTSNFATYVLGSVVPFDLEQSGANEFTGKFSSENYLITKKITINSFSISTEILIEKKNQSIPLPEVKTSINDKKRISGKSSFLAPSLETQELFLVYSDGNSTNNLFREGKDLDLIQPNTNIVSLNSHYFSSALIDKSEIIPEFIINHKSTDSVVNGFLVYKPSSSDSKSMKLTYATYTGPKDLKILESIDPKLSQLINFGMFSSIAKPMLITMKWFFSITGNWGLAIILLTLLVRMIVMPLHIMSFRSMKTMQKIQPQIQALREKYKDDAMTLNTQMMDLMKKNKANPLSGCLPMFLQIPVFFALYRVFGQSIELYKAPFYFWIKDLSIMDPFYVLPVLMAIVMYLQQKMTPSTMDPAQAKMMQFLPLIFSFMMISLPSALTLYIFVSTLFGIIQQFLFLKEKNALTVKEAKI